MLDGRDDAAFFVACRNHHAKLGERRERVVHHATPLISSQRGFCSACRAISSRIEANGFSRRQPKSASAARESIATQGTSYGRGRGSRATSCGPKRASHQAVSCFSDMPFAGPPPTV